MHFLRRRSEDEGDARIGHNTGSGITYGRHSKIDLTRGDASSRSRSQYVGKSCYQMWSMNALSNINAIDL